MLHIAHIVNKKINNISVWSEKPDGEDYLDVTDHVPAVKIGDHYINGRVYAKDAFTELDKLKDYYIANIALDAQQLNAPLGIKEAEILSFLLLCKDAPSFYHASGNTVGVVKSEAFIESFAASVQERQKALKEAYHLQEKIKKAKTVEEVQKLCPRCPVESFWIHPEIA